MPRKPKQNRLLPQCEGPKLHAFKDGAASIDFKRLISEDDPQNASGGGQAHVFEVSILSKSYALKVFKFYDDEEDRAALSDAQQQIISVDLLHAHMDPFYSECRAYGRLIEAKLNGEVAVRCHGYLTLPAEKEEELRRDFDVDKWIRPEDEYSRPMPKREPFRAIVKDLVTEDAPFTEKIIKKMLKDLKRIRKLGVYPMDIRARNYKGGLLVDFSVAMTEPHYLFYIKPPHQVATYKRDDLLSFDQMMEDEGVNTWERATPNPEYCKKLRPRKKTKYIYSYKARHRVNHDGGF